ncbi:FAD/FMN-containing dehydrogenase [Algoriphagus sp. 4150]|uniref:D-arabinono-1,4-lactone oxidase n=1 Tax=Algoriphagus sp. 4150 TaxID=2817756 RepID=UPI0028675640|nr:D-arabinono-1,4-lactone oxidase [Algoriphagus sp. 4150]MDR7127863.1 FAD/FMN-containing dehydrogenase [Algoriphagus sp. 4150]
MKMKKKWQNWSGSIRFTPREIEKPRDEEGVRQVILRAKMEGKQIRVVGAGHSSVPLVVTDNIFMSLEELKGMVDHNPSHNRVVMLPGTDIKETGKLLIKHKLSMHNTGDVDKQFLGGAFATGTHGSGRKLQNLAGMITGCRLVDGHGKIHDIDENDPLKLNAAKISLGALGIITQFTLQTVPADKFIRQEFWSRTEACLENLDKLIEGNTMFDFYWYPRNDLVKLRICNRAEDKVQRPAYGVPAKEQEGWLYQILPQERDLKFEEMEYLLPLESGPDCFQEIRKRIKEKHRHYVGWRILYRTIAADEVFLSPSFSQDSVSISILQNNELEYQSYFDDIEPIFRAYGGRPHWAKKHSLTAEGLRCLYPKWEQFMQLRRELDPEGIFLNDYLKQILDV